MQNNPYTETLTDGWYERTFKSEVLSGEMVWHRDREDRYIEPIEPTNWFFQIDDTLPIKIEGRIFVPKGSWHRAIKGTGDLKIRIKKL
jgi:hypothetical protein